MSRQTIDIFDCLRNQSCGRAAQASAQKRVNDDFRIGNRMPGTLPSSFIFDGEDLRSRSMVNERDLRPQLPASPADRRRGTRADQSPPLFRCLAATKPSPPLFPLPQRMETRCGNPAENSRKTAFATFLPAGLLKLQDGEFRNAR